MLFRRRHTANTVDVVQAAFPQRLRADVQAALEVVNTSSHEPHVGGSVEFLVSGEKVCLPGRVYFAGSSAESVGECWFGKVS